MSAHWEPPGLRDLVKRLAYKPNWMIYLGTDNEDDRWLTLHIVSETPDSYQPDRTIRVNHSFLVPMATYNEATWLAWLFDRIRDVESHEAWQREVHDGHARVRSPPRHLSVFAGPEPDGFHLSISHRLSDGSRQPGRYPTWDEIVDARYRFGPLDKTLAMLLPPQDEYVNVHPTTFHLWEMP